MEKLINKLNDYFKMELHYTKVHLTNETDITERSRICWLCLQRCLGACQYAEMLGLPYATVEAIYNTQRELLMKLEEGGDEA
jgi:hypothetical protein